jgi:excisionase family DNA binding protein
MTYSMARITVDEIAHRLSLGRIAIYELLQRGEIPAIRLGRRWIITRYAYDAWEHTCGRNGVPSNHGRTQAQV